MTSRLGEVSPALSAVFPALMRASPAQRQVSRPRADVAADGRFPVLRGVRALLRELAREKPVLLVLDDLQWADSESTALLAHLLRRPPPCPVLGAVAFRTGRVSAEVAAALELAVREGDGRWITLSPLARPHAEAVLEAQDVPPSRRDRIYRDSGGNPFYLDQLARVPLPDGAALSDAAADGIPVAVAAALTQELADLPAAARLLAQAVAVAGEPCAVDFAAAVAGQRPHTAEELLGELLRADLLRHRAAPPLPVPSSHRPPRGLPGSRRGMAPGGAPPCGGRARRQRRQPGRPRSSPGAGRAAG